MEKRPAMCLEGLALEDGWKVINRIEPGPLGTGGSFSIGYRVKNENGQEGFLKALDFSQAFQSPDVAKALESMTAAYNFERMLLEKCKTSRLTKISIPVANGQVKVPGEFGPLSTVMYLIFEMADGDVRKHYKSSQTIDLAWCLRSLHNTAVGLRQLHGVGIAHQDLKPSNVLVFKDVCKVSDLGRASDRKVPYANDELQTPGDTSYMPPEQCYGYLISDEFERRYGIDLYHLGSLIFFYFADMSATQALKVKLKAGPGKNLTEQNFENDLPYLRQAFFEAVTDLEANVAKKAGKLTADIILMVKELCEPDPARRGDLSVRGHNQYELERYISRLNLLAGKAEYELR
jgi:serine/threonine protein kinase